MALLEITDLVVQHGGDRILDGPSFVIQAGEKVGLIGTNGCGKTTLARSIAGEIEPDAGAIRFEEGSTDTVVYVEQHFPSDFSGTALDFMVQELVGLRQELRDLEHKMGHVDGAAMDRTLRRYAHVRGRYDEAAGDEAESRARTILERNGIAYLADTPVQDLSGGEKNRIQIARAVFKRPGLLILDEPGNHLDAWGLAWLEGLLASYPAAALIISHNRYLLDRVTDRILELRAGRVRSYTGNYSAYRRTKLKEAVATAQGARADQKHLERLEAMVAYLAQLARAKPDPSVGKRLKARRTQLARAKAEAREAPKLEDGRIAIRFNDEKGRADIALDIKGFSFAYGDRTLFSDAATFVAVGDKVALIGPNGSGKTTLLKRIVEQGDWNNPVLRLGPSMKVAYCAQTEHVFDDDASIEDNLRRLGSITRERVFQLISRYLFAYEDLDRPVATLSGGEINRLQLARAELVGANFLILDEPTNHLDIRSREAVEQALIEFPGTVLVVSHDRYLLDSVVKRVVYIDGCRLEALDGAFSDFWFSVGRWMRTGEGVSKRNGGTAAGTGGATGRTAPAASSSGVDGESARAVREPSGWSAAAADPTEQRLLKLEAEKIALERRLEAAYTSGDLKAAKSLSRELEKAERLYSRLYESWGQ